MKPLSSLLLSVLALSKLIFCLPANADVQELPLSFEFGKDNPLKSRIYLNPLLSMVKINDLATREVLFYKSNVTHKIEEETGEWYSLVSNEPDPSPRYALLKNELCNEKDFRISWVDSKGKAHANVTQRLGPSPLAWLPRAQIRVTTLKYDSKQILVEYEYQVNKDNLNGAQKLSDFTPVVELESCQLLFDKPVPEPKLNTESKSIVFDSSYADHKCVFNLRLSVLVFNKDTECRDMMQTTNETSAKIALSCEQTQAYECPKSNENQPCKMTCNPQINADADYHYGIGEPEPFVKVEWRLPEANDKSPVAYSIVRYSQIDVIHNNLPLAEFNSTVDKLTNATHLDLKPFSKSIDTLYSIQVCLVHDGKCSEEPKWQSVPRHPVYAVGLIDELPPPLTTTTSTTTTTTTPAPVPTTPVQQKPAGKIRGGKKPDNSSSLVKPATQEPVASSTDGPKKPAIDNLVAIVTTTASPNVVVSTAIQEHPPPQGGNAIALKYSPIYLVTVTLLVLLQNVQ